MDVCLTGSSPCATTVGILLLTRARQLGFRLTASVVGDPDDVVPIAGPAVVYAPVLAGCGVGREFGSGAIVVLPGGPTDPVMVSLHPHGETGWFFVDRTGSGFHPASQAYVRLSRDPRPAARELGRLLRSGLEALGLSTDPAVLDVLFGADIAPLTRIAVGLRAGRAMSGSRGASVTRFAGAGSQHDPLPLHPTDPLSVAVPRDVRWVVDSLSPAVRDLADRCLALGLELAAEDGGRDLALLWHLAEIGSHLVQLPAGAMLPPLGAAEDSVATALEAALRAEGDEDANRQLGQMFRFLGGRYVAAATGPTADCGASPPPPSADRVGRWQWFGAEVRRARKVADALWPNIVDPPQ